MTQTDRRHAMTQVLGYTGKIYFIVDNEDKTIEQYQKNYELFLFFQRRRE